MDSFAITPEIRAVAERAIEVALEFEELLGHKLGISASVGEVLVAEKFKLRLVRSDIEAGYDAFDESGKKVQVKVRRSEGGRGREIPTDTSPTSKFSKHFYHYALLALLTRGYRLYRVYRANHGKIEACLKGRRKRILRVGKFKQIGTQVYP